MTQSMSNYIQSRCSISHLLPYDPAVKTKARLQDRLKEYLFLLIVTKDAIESLKRGELTSFDPLVGENACQIRAVKIALVADQCFADHQRFISKIDGLKTKISGVLSDPAHLSKTTISLKDYLEDKHLDISLSDDEIFLIESYILTKTKLTKPFSIEKPLVENATTDTKKIREISDISSSFANEIIKKIRRDLSARSVTSIQEMAAESAPFEITRDLVSDRFIVMHNGLQCLPYYWLTRTVMIQALNHHIPIVLKAEQTAKDKDFATVENTTLFFETTADGYRATSREMLSPETLALVLVGKTSRNYKELPDKKTWREDLLHHSPLDFILAYAAAHRQYPNESKDCLLDNIDDENYAYHKAKAEEWGCSLTNPSLFFLSHAFCDKVANINEHK